MRKNSLRRPSETNLPLAKNSIEENVRRDRDITGTVSAAHVHPAQAAVGLRWNVNESMKEYTATETKGLSGWSARMLRRLQIDPYRLKGLADLHRRFTEEVVTSRKVEGTKTAPRPRLRIRRRIC